MGGTAIFVETFGDLKGGYLTYLQAHEIMVLIR